MTRIKIQLFNQIQLKPLSQKLWSRSFDRYASRNFTNVKTSVRAAPGVASYQPSLDLPPTVSCPAGAARICNAPVLRNPLPAALRCPPFATRLGGAKPMGVPTDGRDPYRTILLTKEGTASQS